MKIVFLTSMYSENMGYSENFLPKAVAKMGHEVHVISSTAQVYFNSPNYKKTYEPFLGPNIVIPGMKQVDGYTLHRLPMLPAVRKNLIRLQGFRKLLEQLHPDIIQSFEIYSFATYDAAVEAKRLGIKFFTESHTHASVFNTKSFKIRLRHRLLNFSGKLELIDKVTVKHYPIAEDSAKISREFFKVSPAKIKVQSLGVDADMFTPVISDTDIQEKNKTRERYGLSSGDLVCIYTGRFTQDKNPACLAQAVDHLQTQGHAHIRAFFVGNGTPEDVNYIKVMKGCIIHPFVKVNELPPFYRLADIGVWPKQESTSQLDAMACGLPVIASNQIGVKERIQGSGLLYEENNFTDLADKILQLTDPSRRKSLGYAGLKKIKEKYSWDAIAEKRVADYKEALLQENNNNQ